MNDLKIHGESIYLKKADYKTWSAARDKRYFDGYQKYDPAMPETDEAAEKTYYIDHVDAGNALLYGIYTNENEHIGYINAFDLLVNGKKVKGGFGDSIPGGVCETGVWLFGEKYFGKGYASKAYGLFFDRVLKKYKLEKTIISTFAGNERATRLYKKIGYKETGSYNEGEHRYLKMELLF
jgi:RimJ/RimL family protein N-acetyltransferase